MAACALVSTNAAQAADATWGGNSTGNWSVGSNWSPTTAPGTAGTAGTNTNTAYFNNASGTYTITLNSSYSIKNITFGGGGTANYTIGATGSSVFTISDGGTISITNPTAGTQTISAPIVLGSSAGGNQSVTFNNNSYGGGSLNFTGPITSSGTSGTTSLILNNAFDNTATNTISGNISDSGTGTVTALTNGYTRNSYWVLTGANTYSGQTWLTSGVVRANDGVGISPNSNVILNGGVWETSANITRSLGSGAGQISLQGSSAFSASNGASIVVAFGGLANPTKLVLGSPNFSVQGGISINQAGDFGNIDFRNAVDTNGQTFAIQNGNNGGIGILNMSGVISGNGSFNKGGSNGNMVITGANTYTGTTGVGGNSLLTVTSFNSVATNPTLGTVHSASSNLGAPTTVANGTIDIGSSYLIYKGTGETTDRNINFSGNYGYILQNASTGNLKFVGNFTSSYPAATQFILSGGINTAPTSAAPLATGEFAGVIQDGAGGFTSVQKGDTYHNGNIFNTSADWTLSGANTYTGTTNVNIGYLTIANNSALGSTAGGTAVLDSGSLVLDGTTANGPLTIGAEALTISGPGYYTRAALLNHGGNNSYAGAITLANGNGWGIVAIGSDAGTLTLTGGITGSGINLSIIGAGDGVISGAIATGTGGLTKNGTGTWTLSGANTYDGTNIVNGAPGVGTTVNGGTLLLDKNAGGSINGATGTELKLGGGNFQIKGASAGASSQTMGALTLATQTGNTITVDPNGGTGTTVILGNSWSRANYSTLHFDYSSGNAGTRGVQTTGATTGAAITNGVYGWATVKDQTGIGFATLDGSNNIVRYQGATTLPTTTTSDSVNYITKVGDAGYTGSTITLAAGGKNINSLQLDGSGASAGVVDLNGGKMTVTSGGILATGANGFTIQNGQVGTDGAEVIVHQYATGTLTINGTISDSGGVGGSLTKDGPGTLLLGGANIYSGPTTINGGTLGTTTSDVIGDNSGVMVNSGATFSLGGNDTIGTLYGSGNINLNSNALTVSTYGGVFSGVISGNGGSLVVNAYSNSYRQLVLTGANTYTGITTIAGGALSIKNASALGSTAGGTIVNSGASLELDGYSGTSPGPMSIGNEALTLNGFGDSGTGALHTYVYGGIYDYAGLITLGSSASIRVGAGGAGSAGYLNLTNTGTITGPGFDLTLDSSYATYAYGTLASSIGTGTGGVIKAGAGTWTLTGASTYTGATSINAGELIIKNNAALGDVAGGTTVASGGSLGLDGSAGALSVGNEALSLSGTGAAGNVNGALHNIAGNNTYGGLVSQAGDATIQSDRDTAIALTNGGTITGSGFNLTLTGEGNGSIASAIGTGAGGVIKTGQGNWTLSGANTYTGTTAVNNGILTVKSGSALGGTTGGTTVAAGAGLAIDGSAGNVTVGAEALNLKGSGVSGTTGALQNVAGNNVYQGAITLAAPVTIQSDAGSLNLQGGISGAYNLTLAGAGNGSVSGGVIATGIGTLTKLGSGTWTLSSANTYTGLTTVSAGTLAYGVTNALGTGKVMVNGSTAILDLGANHSDTVGTITLAGGGSIKGTGTSALTTTGSFELQSGTMSAALAGSSAVNKTTTGTVVLSGTNNNSGATTITAGNLQFAKQVSLYNNNSGNWSTNIDVMPDATLGLNVGGTGEFTATDVDTIVQNVNFENGSYIGMDTTNAGGNFTYSNDLTDAAGGFGSIGLNKLGSGTLTLSVTNDYSGNTIVTAGTLALSGSGTLGQGVASVSVLNGATLNLGGKSITNVLGTMTGGTVANGTITNNSGTYAMQSGTVSAALKGTNALLKTTTGTAVLSGANTYTGTTTVGASNGTDAGILQLSGAGKISNAATTVYTGTLDLNGTTQQITSLALGGGALGTSAAVSIGSGELKLGGDIAYSAANNPIGATISSSSTGHLSLLGNRTFNVNDSTAAATDLTISANIQNGDATARNISMNGNGKLVLSGTNTYTGTTTISSGTMQFAKEVSLYNNNTAGTGWTGTNIVVSNGATLGLNVGGTGEFTASDVNTLSALSGMAAGSTLALDSTSGNFSDSGVIAGSGVNLTKNGVNNVTLSGANTYTGTTTVNGGRLVLDRSTGGAGTINGAGTGTALALGGGTFQFKGASSGVSTQTMGNLTLANNTSNGIRVTASGSGTAALTVGDTWTRGNNTGSALDINLSAPGSTLTSNVATTNGLVTGTGGVAFATVTDGTGTGFATVTGGNVVRYTAASTLTAGVTSAPTTNYVTKVGDAGYNSISHSLTMTGSSTINSLQLDTSGGTGILNLGGNQMTVTDRALLMTGTNSFTVQNGTLASSGNDEFIVHQYSTGALTFAATLQVTGNLTKTGTGELILQDTDFSGGITTVLGGQLTVQSNNHIGFGSKVIVASGAALSFHPMTSQFLTNTPMTLSGAGLAANPAGALNNWGGNNTEGGLVTLAGDTTIQSDSGLLTLSGGLAGPYNLTLAGAGNGAITTAPFALGTGSLTKTGAGTWTISTPAAYSGGTIISGGSLVLSGTGSYGTGAVSISGGTADLGGNSITNTLGSLTGGGTITNGTVTNNGGTYDLQNGTVSAVLAGTNGLTKTTSNTVTLTGVNTYTGVTTIDGGVLNVASLAAINTSSSIGNGSVGGSAADLVFGGGTLQHTLASAVTTNRLFTIGDVNGLTATLDSSAVSSAHTVSFTGTGALGLGGSGARTLTLTGSNTGNNTLASVIGNGVGGATSLNKTGAGTWVVSGANTYSGGTTVSLGTLVVSNASGLGSGAVNIGNGATLSNTVNYDFADNVVNNGTINSNGHNTSFASGKTLSGIGLLSGGGTFTVNGILSPGNSPGTVTVGAATTLTLTSGTTTIWQLSSISSSVAGTDYDTFVLNPTAVVNVDGTLQIVLDGINYSNNPYWQTDHTYTLFSGGGTFSGNFAALSGNYTHDFGNGTTGTFGYSPGTGQITYLFAVPEPQTWALAALGLSAVLFRLRRKQRVA